MGYKYVVLGAGRQGTACAYDMLKFGEAEGVTLADQSLETARAAAGRVNRLLATNRARGIQLDASNRQAVVDVLTGTDAFVSAVPYYLNLDVTRAAIEAGTSMCDLGGNTDVARQQLELDDQARAAGISVIPDCGQLPGMGNSLILYAMGLLDEAEEVFMWDGGLPQDPRPPFHYLLTFSVAGLTNEFAEPAVILRDGQVTEVPALEELEEVDFPLPVGRLEAFTAGGGLSTLPWTLQGQLKTLQNKVVRYPGHCAQLRAFRDLGLWRSDPVSVGDQVVVPRDLFHSLFAPLVSYPDGKDMVVIRIRVTGRKAGERAEAILDLLDLYDEATGFTAMERCTGWDGSIVAAMMARGQTRRGAIPRERSVPTGEFVRELARRGIEAQTRVVSLGRD